MCGCEDHTDITAIDLSRFDRLIDDIAKQLHDGKLKPSDLNQDLISQTYKELNEGASKGYGKNWTKFPMKTTLPTELKKNIYTFSSAKTYAQLEAINHLLYDIDGKLRPFNEFAQLAKKTGHQFNKNYLQAEYQTARTAAQMAEKWEKIQETKDIFPNLKFRTVGDSAVRDDHAKLNGVIKPIDDPFWSRYYPPLDWRCRCDVVSTAENVTTHEEKAMPKVNFKGNVALDKEIFTSKGSFFKLAAGDENVKRNMELAKLNAPYELGYTAKNGKKVLVNIFADTEDRDNNIDAAITIVDNLNKNISIRSHVNVQGFKNAEFFDGKRMGDMTIMNSQNIARYISNTFDSKFGRNGQLRDEDEAFIVLNIGRKIVEGDINPMARQLWAKFRNARNCMYVVVINNGKAIQIDRASLTTFENLETALKVIKDKRTR